MRPKAESGAGQVASGGRPAERVHTGGLSLPARPTAGKSSRRKPKKLTPEQLAERNEKRQERRHGRWSLRYRIQQITELKALRNCGYGTIPGKDVELHIRNTPDGNRANYSNALHCGSVWACPQCAATIANGRAQEVRQIMKTAVDAGYSAAFGTFTLRHRKQHRLRDLWGALSHGWARATGGRQWIKQREAMGIVGFVRVVEVTYGKKNGWHVHVHVLLIFDRPKLTIKHARNATHQMWERWAAGLEAKGFTCDRNKGHDVRLATLDYSAENKFEQYFTKMAHEMTSGYAKVARGESVAPFQIAELATGEKIPEPIRRQWLPVWAEWEQGSKARKQMLISKELREWAELPEVTDEELAKNEDGSVAEDVVIALPALTWRYLTVERPALACVLLDVAENGGLLAATDWLEAQGLRWHWPPPPTPQEVQREQLLTEVRAIFGRGAKTVKAPYVLFL
ncbi:MAG: protein rep [Pyrinomonadaceae bacterium]